MAEQSAGLLLYRRTEDGGIQVFLGHPGGPFWKNRDAGAWSIPKGLVDEGEETLAAALREFEEETGFRPEGPFVQLGPARLKSGKIVNAWACEGDLDADAARSNTFEMEWPPRSGRVQRFPEIDRFAWFDLEEARRKMNPAQARWLDGLAGTPAG